MPPRCNFTSRRQQARETNTPALRSSPSLHHPKLTEHIGHHAAAVLPGLCALLCFFVWLHICDRHEEGDMWACSEQQQLQCEDRESVLLHLSIQLHMPSALAPSAALRCGLHCTCRVCCAGHSTP